MSTKVELSPPFPATEYVTYSSVPIFRTGVYIGDRLVDERLLYILANNGNKRIAETGDYVPLMLGHTHRNPAEEQPPIIGFAGNFRVSDYADGHAIYADFYILRDHVGYLKSYPRRSVEVWMDGDEENWYIDPIALIRETPKCDLGLLLGRKAAYSKGLFTMPDFDIQTIVDAVLAALKSTPEWEALTGFAEDARKKETEDEPDHAAAPELMSRIAELEAVLARERKARRDIARKAELTQLAQHREFDVERELARAETWSDEEFDKYCQEVLSRMPARPAPGKIVFNNVRDHARNEWRVVDEVDNIPVYSKYSPEQSRRIREYAIQHMIDYDAAADKLFGNNGSH